jgi:hypothetical protein
MSTSRKVCVFCFVRSHLGVADAFSSGRPLQALELLLKNQDNDASLRRGAQLLLETLWRHLSFGVSLTVNDSNSMARQLLALSRRIDSSRLSVQDADEVRSAVGMGVGVI